MEHVKYSGDWSHRSVGDNGRAADQTAYKPGSVPPGPGRTPAPDAATIPLDRPLRGGSRDQPGRLRPTTALPACAGAESLFGLAPGGACRAVDVAANAVRSYRTLSPLPLRREAVCFLWRYPWGRPRRALPAAMSSWSPDFPRPQKAAAAAQPSDPRRSVGAGAPAVKGVSWRRPVPWRRRWDDRQAPRRSADEPPAACSERA